MSFAEEGVFYDLFSGSGYGPAPSGYEDVEHKFADKARVRKYERIKALCVERRALESQLRKANALERESLLNRLVELNAKLHLMSALCYCGGKFPDCELRPWCLQHMLPNMFRPA